MEINCFYFGKFGYTIVPAQIQEDIQRIKDQGATYVTLNALEQDFKSAVENIDLTINEILKAGMKPMLATEQWFGIFGGVQYFPSVFTLKNSETQVIKKDESILMTDLGPVSSIYHEKTQKEIRKNLDRAFELWGFDGLLWFEPILPLDYSIHAKQQLNDSINESDHMVFCKSIFEAYHQRIKEKFGNKIIAWLHSNGTKTFEIETFSKLKGLNFFGYQESVNQTGPMTLDANGSSNSLSVINHIGVVNGQHPALQQKIESIISNRPAMLGYYHYPGNVEDPEKAMQVIYDALSRKKLANATP